MPAAVTKYLQPRFATRLKVASRQTAKSLGKTDKVICESGDFLFRKEGIVCAGLNIWQGLLNMWAVMWWMFCHLGAVCLEIQYEINHTNLLLDNTAFASFFIEFDTKKKCKYQIQLRKDCIHIHIYKIGRDKYPFYFFYFTLGDQCKYNSYDLMYESVWIVGHTFFRQ